MVGREAEFGGGYVRLAFNGQDGARLKVGTHLSADEIRAMRNHRSLIRSEYIAVYPIGEATSERHVVHLGRGAFDVIAGCKLNDEPLSKDEAERLASRSDA